MAGTYTINDSTVVGSVIDSTAGKLVSITMTTAPQKGHNPKSHDASTNLPTGGVFCLSDGGTRALFSCDLLGVSPGSNLLVAGKGTYSKLVFNSTVPGAVFTVVTA
jgi:hypothetical protein